MTGGRDAVFTGRSAWALSLPGGWDGRTDGLPAPVGAAAARSARNGRARGPPVGVLLRWWCTFASAASITAPARCVAALIVFAFVGLGIDLILSSAGFLRRANQVVVVGLFAVPLLAANGHAWPPPPPLCRNHC
jgi:hypothetical protein